MTSVKVKPVVVQYKDLAARVVRGKWEWYTYLTPRWGYKRACKYDRVAYVYFVGKFDSGYVDVRYFKHVTKKHILAYLAEFKNSRRYLKAKRELKSRR